MKYHYNATGQRRKELAATIAEITGAEVKYLGTPSYAYAIGDYRIEKDGTLVCPEDADNETLSDLTEKLANVGFTYDDDTYQFNLCFPRRGLDDAVIQRLKNLISSKATVLKAALNADNLEIEVTDDTINFPWFISRPDPESITAYSLLCVSLIKMAETTTRISPEEKPQENPRYVMRLFLVRLGFIGDEYKDARRILLRNLPGNSSWKSGSDPRAESEVINNEDSESGTD